MSNRSFKLCAMGFHGSCADPEEEGDFPGAVTIGDQPYYFTLPAALSRVRSQARLG